MQLSSCEQLQAGGEQVAQFLSDTLKKQNISMSEKQIFDIKHEFMEVCGSKSTFQSTMGKESEGNKQYKLPDGATVDVGHTGFECGEFCFQTERYGNSLYIPPHPLRFLLTKYDTRYPAIESTRHGVYQHKLHT